MAYFGYRGQNMHTLYRDLDLHKKCVGFGKQCVNFPNAGFDYCQTCFDLRTRHIQIGYCSAKRGTCYNKHVHGKSWCYACFRRSSLEAELKNAERALNSHGNECQRGGCVCSLCDNLFDQYEQAKKAFDEYTT